MSRRIFSGILLSLLLMGMLALAFNIKPVKAQPTIIIVPDDYPTIQGAINAASDGDTVFVRNGTYYENVTVDKSLSLIGESRKTTIIDGGKKGIVANIVANSVVLTGFTIKNSGLYYPNSSICLNGANFINITDNIIEQSNYGILLLSSNNITINANQIADNLGHGIVLNNSYNTTIKENNLTGNNAEAINLFQAGTNYISKNSFLNNAAAIWMDQSSNNVFSNNNIQNCTASYMYVVGWANSEGNWFVDNDINNFDRTCQGLVLYNCNESLIRGNNIDNCAYGLYLSSSNRNRIYHNNVVNDTLQAYIFETSINNGWDDGYPYGGNYWSDYNGTDVYSGSYQNLTGSDGIGDTPYVIDANNTDHYPLMNPWSPHDIAVTNVWPSKTVVGQGYNLIVNAPVFNLGDYTETFNVTVYANTSLIASAFVNVTLSAGASVILVCVCNTTSLAYGNYTINVCAWPVPGETNTANNNCTGGNVVVTITGDINGDFKVDMRDIALVVRAFGSTIGSINWNANADINDDGTVNMRDVALVARHFGQHYP